MATHNRSSCILHILIKYVGLNYLDLTLNKCHGDAEHQTRMAEVPTSILSGGNILLLEFFVFM